VKFQDIEVSGLFGCFRYVIFGCCALQHLWFAVVRMVYVSGIGSSYLSVVRYNRWNISLQSWCGRISIH